MTKIFIISHKKIIENFKPPFIPFYVGKAADDNSEFNDRTGDSIHDKNPYYSELTAQYWIWRNLLIKEDPNENIGFCHYRRYFSFDSPTQEISGIQKINHMEKINTLLSGEYDVILAKQELFPVKRHWFSLSMRFNKLILPWSYLNLREQFELNHEKIDLELAVSLLPKDHQIGFIKHLNSNKLSPYNMYIAKPTILINYFNILFPWLFTFEKKIALEGKTAYQARLPGFIAERFASYYFNEFHNPALVNISLIK